MPAEFTSSASSAKGFCPHRVGRSLSKTGNTRIFALFSQFCGQFVSMLIWSAAKIKGTHHHRHQLSYSWTGSNVDPGTFTCVAMIVNEVTYSLTWRIVQSWELDPYGTFIDFKLHHVTVILTTAVYVHWVISGPHGVQYWNSHPRHPSDVINFATRS